MSDLEDKLAWQIAAAGLAQPQREVVFAPPRRWRFDFAWPDLKVAVEVEGGIWIRGGHSRGVGMGRDAAKYNEAALLGWMLIRVTGVTIADGSALAWIERALAIRELQREELKS